MLNIKPVMRFIRIPYVSKDLRSGLNNWLQRIAKKSVASADDEVTEQLIIATVKQILDLNNTIKAQTKISDR